MENTKTATITAEGYTFRCADEETFKKVERAIEKMDSEDFIIKVNDKEVSIDGTEEDVLCAFGSLVITLLAETSITSVALMQIFTKALTYNTKEECSEGSEEK